jgi:hypothetical protein
MMSDLLDDLAAAEERSRKRRGIKDPCSACALLEGDTLSDQEKAVVRAALAGTIGEVRLSKILTNRGYPVSIRKIREHRAEKRTP